MRTWRQRWILSNTDSQFSLPVLSKVGDPSELNEMRQCVCICVCVCVCVCGRMSDLEASPLCDWVSAAVCLIGCRSLCLCVCVMLFVPAIYNIYTCIHLRWRRWCYTSMEPLVRQNWKLCSGVPCQFMMQLLWKLSSVCRVEILFVTPVCSGISARLTDDFMLR